MKEVMELAGKNVKHLQILHIYSRIKRNHECNGKNERYKITNVPSRHKRNTLSAKNISLDKINSRLGTVEEKII